ncbi:MAG: hypothetical protein AVDCRST_MAG52-2435, partial [uncultured Blastococcus sp.]
DHGTPPPGLRRRAAGRRGADRRRVGRGTAGRRGVRPAPRAGIRRGDVRRPRPAVHRSARTAARRPATAVRAARAAPGVLAAGAGLEPGRGRPGARHRAAAAAVHRHRRHLGLRLLLPDPRRDEAAHRRGDRRCPGAGAGRRLLDGLPVPAQPRGGPPLRASRSAQAGQRPHRAVVLPRHPDPDRPGRLVRADQPGAQRLLAERRRPL